MKDIMYKKKKEREREKGQYRAHYRFLRYDPREILSGVSAKQEMSRLIKCSRKYSHTRVRALLRRISEGVIYVTVKEKDYFRACDCRITAIIYCTIQC